MIVQNRAGLTEPEFERWREPLATQATLERALKWMFAQSPPLSPEDIVAQDEYSYDLLVPLPEGVYLSYDTC